MSAVETQGVPLLETVPKDIDDWCPAYAENDADQRAAFWAGFVSTLSRYESTWNPRAVGGGGRWFGLMQIYPPTAEFPLTSPVAAQREISPEPSPAKPPV